jgi:hypothetical protein
VTAFALVSGKLAAPHFDVEALAKLIALRREIEANAEVKAFYQDFVALQVAIASVETHAYDPQKRTAYAASPSASPAQAWLHRRDHDRRHDGRADRRDQPDSRRARSHDDPQGERRPACREGSCASSAALERSLRQFIK